MGTAPFPLEKIFGSRTRVKVITLFTTGVKRPYFVREIARSVDERLNAVRRELDILEKVGMLTSYEERRRKYYRLNNEFILLGELGSIMQKAGPGVDDALFKHIERLGDIQYLCVTGFFTGAIEAPTDLLVVGTVNEQRLDIFIKRIEDQLNHEVRHTPMTENEYRYRVNFNDLFLRSIFSQPHKALIDKLDAQVKPGTVTKQPSSTVVRS